MSSCIPDPRRLPRIRVRLSVEVNHGSVAWSALTDDFSPGGCLLVSSIELSLGTNLRLSFRAASIPERLHVEGIVVWSRGTRCGVSFDGRASGAGPSEWYRRLVLAQPDLLPDLAKLTRRIPLGARLRAPACVPEDALLDPDERRLVSSCRHDMPVGRLALETRLPPQRFVRALFKLLGRAVIISPDVVVPSAAGDDPRSLRASAVAAAAAARQAVREARAVSDLAVAVKDGSST